MRVSLEETLEKTNIMVIDGSMSTALEALVRPQRLSLDRQGPGGSDRT